MTLQQGMEDTEGMDYLSRAMAGPSGRTLLLKKSLMLLGWGMW